MINVKGVMLSTLGETKKLLSPNSKFYYRHSVQDDTPKELNRLLMKYVLSSNPKSVFEFGCGNGKNLELITDRKIERFGIDISQKSIRLCRQKMINSVCSDEKYLELINSDRFDISFTCSVLDHIKNIDCIILELKRITRGKIYLMESNDQPDRFWYEHDYQSYGFKPLDSIYSVINKYKTVLYTLYSIGDSQE